MATSRHNKSIRSEDQPATQGGGGGGKAWGLMFYMAADNNLSELAGAKIDALRRAGSTVTTDIIVQFDGRGQSPSTRVRIGNGREAAEEVTELAESNSGNKKPLIEFIQTSRNSIRPQRSVVVIWNHGLGLDPDSDDEHGGHGLAHAASAATAGRRATRTSTTPTPRAELAAMSPDFASALFPVAVLKGILPAQDDPVPALTARARVIRIQAIAEDWTSKDHLDNKELKQAMAAVARDGIIDILAFEACLMNTVEVAYQVRDSVRFVVGSQSNYPQPGWPYAGLHSLFQNGPATSGDVAGVARSMTETAASVTAGEYLTASALDLSKAENFAGRISALADAMLQVIDNAAALDAISNAHLSAQAFADSETVDLIDFCSLLEQFDAPAPVTRAARAVRNGAASFIIATRSRGADVRNAQGISIYFPKRRFISPKYAGLDFAKNTKWLSFLKKYVPKIYPDPFADIAAPPSPPLQSTPPGGAGGETGHRH